LDSINFGLDVDNPGYNLFLTGLTGTGKATTIKTCIEEFITDKESKGVSFQPKDWCYVYNFSDPDHPKALSLPQGHGKAFNSRMERLLKTLHEEVPKVFSNEDYNKRKQTVMEKQQREYQNALNDLDIEARNKGLMVEMTSAGAALVPVVDGKAMSREDFLALEESEREAVEEKRREMMKKVDDTMGKFRDLSKEAEEEMKIIKREAGEFSISGPFAELFYTYSDHPELVSFLQEVKEYTLDNLDIFIQTESSSPLQGLVIGPQVDPFMVYKVNLFVDNSSAGRPPVIIESNPNWFNMFGKIERKALMGTYVSDHTMIKPGSVQLANGGYLILNVRDVLLNPGVWEGLKRTIRNKEVNVEEPWEQYGFFTPQGMRPQPIPIEIKMILMGEDYLYQLLSVHDEDFWEMFKVKVDFDYQVNRTEENMAAYASFIRQCCDTEELLAFDRSGVGKVLEQAARAVADQEKLSTRFGQLKDVIIESNYWAKKTESPMITSEHVEKAVKQKIYRYELVAERLRQLIIEGTLMVDVEGSVVGQANGLSVYDMGTFSFGRPSRITAKTFFGRDGIINIERESELSGRIHDKGVLILSGYLGWMYAQDKPLSISTSICFEQSYTGVEGDSASSTELYAILSSLSYLPIRQGIAVTGSVNQKGEIQPIGGVNQKIEGFFDICNAKGLTGDQGVIIPFQNVGNLMLREDVVEAVRNGSFSVYAVKTIDDGMEILTGVPAGKKGKNGNYPKGSLHYLVDKRLKEMAEGLKGFQASEETDEKK
ncbi:MAG: ATP-binding protein, partial [Thermodesulfobacteriota bacterium]|nr:ATP-binding protein [Thermodesulfobacteriota bacterium]